MKPYSLKYCHQQAVRLEAAARQKHRSFEARKHQKIAAALWRLIKRWEGEQ